MDERLMQNVQEGDAGSFCLLFEKHGALVRQKLAQMVRNHAIAEELAQDVFVRVYRSRHAYVPTAKFSTWLYRITMNVAYNHFRDSRHGQNGISLDQETARAAKFEIPDRAPSAEHVLVSGVSRQRIRDAIGALPLKQRTAVRMHKYEGMDYSQIARRLGCSNSAVKALMYRAYEALRVELKDLEPAQSPRN